MFDHVVLLFIFLNCITIALERPDIDPSSTVSCWGSWPGGGQVVGVQPSHQPLPTGASLPQHFQLHLHSHLRGRDDGEGTKVSLLPSLLGSPSCSMAPG